MKDCVQRFVFDQQDVRGCVVRLQKSCEAIQATHHYPDALARLLNEFASSAVLLRDSVKIKAQVSIQLRTKGAISLLMADCFDDYKVRAIAEYDATQLGSSQQISLPELGDGAVLAITITPDDGERYQGIVPIESGSLSACLENYFSRSEQLASCFMFFANRQQAVGLALHALPMQKSLDSQRYKDDFQRLQMLLSTLTEQEAFELDNEALLTRLFCAEQCRVFENKSIEFGCHCGVEKSLQAIASLGEQEALQLIAEQEKKGCQTVVVDCHFCFQRYEFDFQSVGALFADKGVQYSKLNDAKLN